MPRIPDAEIARLKQQTDLAALVRSRGVELTRHGAKDLVGRCPFHADTDNPNFIVSPEKGLFHCMACSAAGNAIQFVQRFDGISFRHAFEILNAGAVALVSPTRARVHPVGPTDTPLKKATVPRLPNPLGSAADLSAGALAKVDDAAIMGQVLDYYQERLLKTPAALDYLRGRGLCHDDALQTFRLGFADRTLGLRLPNIGRKEGVAIRTRLQQLGVFRPTGQEHFNGCVVLPIFAAGGGVGELYGRRIDYPRNGAPKHLFLPGPHAGIWNAQALDAGEIILCEAPFDALTFWVHGFHNVTFIYGTEGFTGELFDALLARRVRRVFIAYDADDAGTRAAIRDAARLAVHGVECLRVRFPPGMDANEYACKETPATYALQRLLHAAEWIGLHGPACPEPAAHTPTLAPTLAPSSLSLVSPSGMVETPRLAGE